MWEELIKFWDAIFRKVTYDNMVSVGATTAYTNNGGSRFWIYMPAAGSVHIKTYGGQEKTITLTAGYHPVAMKEIYADSVTACEVCF